MMINVALIGCGNWGPHLARNISGIEGVRLYALVDIELERAKRLSKYYPTAKVFSSIEKILKDDKINAVIIATPAKSHYMLTKKSLKTRKHILVEKPMSLSTDECQVLINMAKKNKRILMVGHTFLYNSGVTLLKKYIDSHDLGDIYYIFSQRLNLGQIRRDVDAIWNFAPHDISIILYLIQDRPVQISARGFSFLQKGISDIAFLNIDFTSGITAHIHVSWLDPVKTRKIVVVGSKKMAIYDDVSADAKLQLYDKSIERYENKYPVRDSFGEFQLKVREGDVLIPKINFVEPLQVECQHFIKSIKENKTPLTDGRHGYKVVKILEAATLSVKRGGRIVKLS